MTSADFHVRLAETEADLRAAQRLRYEVFVQELGGAGALVDHTERLERDALDPYFDHLLLIDRTVDEVVGVYRLMRPEQAAEAGQYYTASEYDLTPLLTSGRRILELGRSCLRQAYRGGLGMHALWSALRTYVETHQIDVLFGVASFHGTQAEALAQPLSFLHHRHLVAEDLRVRALETSFQTMNLLSEPQIDRKAAMLQMPSLIKAYLRAGGKVGEGAFIDHAFNTTDVCLIMETKNLPDRQARIYGGAG